MSYVSYKYSPTNYLPTFRLLADGDLGVGTHYVQGRVFDCNDHCQHGMARSECLWL